MGNENSSNDSREVKDIDTDNIIDSIIKVFGDEKIKVPIMKTAKGIAKGTGVVGTCTIIGGVVAGPIGLAIGSGIGGLAAYLATEGTFQSIPQIFNELPPETKEQIAYEIQSVANKLGIKDWKEFVKVAIICASVANSPQKALVKEFKQKSALIIGNHIQELNRESK